MTYTFLYITLIVAVLNWVAVAKNWKMLDYFSKPGTMIILLFWVWQHSQFRGELSWFALALVFSLVGDILLMLPRDLFSAGLVAFSLAHLAYIRALILDPPLNLASLFILVMVSITGFQVYRGLAAGLAHRGKQNMKTPVLIYIVLVVGMLTSALLTLNRFWWQVVPSLLVSAGALLFAISDTWLAWDRFVNPVNNKLRVRITYHLGQIGINLGAVMLYYFL
jgi:uncharacterized membrane protein YhhN